MQIFFTSLDSSILNIAEIIIAMFFSATIFIFLVLYSIIFLKTKDISYLPFSISLFFLLIYDILYIIALSIYKNNELTSEILSILKMSELLISFSILIILTLIPISFMVYYKSNKYIKIINIFVIVLTFIFNLNYLNKVLEYFINTDRKGGLSLFDSNNLTGRYLILFTLLIIFTSFLSILIDLIKKRSYKKSILIVASSMFSIYILLEPFTTFDIFTKFIQDRIFVSIFIFTLVFYAIVLENFSKYVLIKIRDQSILSNTIDKNYTIINSISSIVNKMEKIDRNVKEVEIYIPDIIRENENAIDIIKYKTTLIEESNNNFLKTHKEKEDVTKEYAKTIENIFNESDSPRREMESMSILFSDTTNEILSKSITTEKLENIIKTLKMTSHTFNENSDNILEYIYKSISRFENINNMTDSIYETIAFVKDITTKTSLLSINAGIQASKAGSVGKSFSVVAKEIGALAAESLRETEQVEKILNDIFSSLISVENSSHNIKKDCDIFKYDIEEMTTNIENLIHEIEEYKLSEPQKIINIKALIKENDNFIKDNKQKNTITNSIRDNILAIFINKNNQEDNVLKQQNHIKNIEEKISMILSVKESMPEFSKDLKEHTKNMHRDILSLSMAIVENDSNNLKNIIQNKEYVVPALSKYL